MKRPSLLAAGVAALAVSAVAVSLYLALAEQSQATTGASTYSHSALGHSVLLDVLRRRGVDASASRGASREKLHDDGLLVLAEPDFDPSPEALRGLLRARHVLLVLPKWSVSGEPGRHGWITLAVLKPLFLAQTVLKDALPGAQAVRPDHDASAITLNTLAAGSPHIEAPPQLIASATLKPVLASADRTLLGYLPRPRGELWVLADPDLINNHGMANGNAGLAVVMIDRARQGGPVLFDETIHGFSSVPNGQFLLLASQPFVGAALSALLAVGLVVWATARRFGVDRPPPAGIAAGRISLIASIAGLMVFAGHLSEMLRRYVSVTIEDVAARLHAPDTGQTEARAAWLTQAEQQRGARDSEAALRAQAATLAATPASPDAAFALAQRIYAWRKEMLRGA